MSLALNNQRIVGLIVVLLLLARLLAGALLPLSADEAYYWLWSKHLAWGYYDHPPMIAFIIRMGTTFFGDTPLGIRIVPILLSAVASAAIWRTGAILFVSDAAGAMACLFFNLTLMVTVEMTFATPDAPALAAAALLMLALAKVKDDSQGYWWLAVGAAGGLGLLSKYTFFFMGGSVLIWLLVDPGQRHWLRRPWPYLGGMIALCIFAPNLWWNAANSWATFVFQFHRIERGAVDLRYLGEFTASQLGLASPFIFLLGATGLVLRKGDEPRSFLLPAMTYPSLAYFAVHALHDRVQGNWPSFLYPALVLAAAGAALQISQEGGNQPTPIKLARNWAAPTAGAILGIVYLQVAFGFLALGKKDPIQRLVGFGWQQSAQDLQKYALTAHTRTIIATDYQTASWLRFYLPRNFDVVQIGQTYRWPSSPNAHFVADSAALYVTIAKRRDLAAIGVLDAMPYQKLNRIRKKTLIESYEVYCLSGARIGAGGKVL